MTPEQLTKAVLNIKRWQQKDQRALNKPLTLFGPPRNAYNRLRILTNVELA